MQHLEYAQAVLKAFSEYTNPIEHKEDTAIRLELYSDGSGRVFDLEKETALFEFNDLQELLVQLLARQRMSKDN